MESKTVCEERLKKQTFLKKEILEKGYDAQQFQEFLERKKYDGGNNIDIWEFPELREVDLKSFETSHSPLSFIPFSLCESFIPRRPPCLNSRTSRSST